MVVQTAYSLSAMADRNPLIFVDRPKNKRACPACGSEKFDGRRIQGGAIHFTCSNKECSHKWQGGLPESMYDPRVPHPPEKYVPTVQFSPVKDRDGRMVGVEEITRRVDPTPEFRKGAPIPPDGEE